MKSDDLTSGNINRGICAPTTKKVFIIKTHTDNIHSQSQSREEIHKSLCAWENGWILIYSVGVVFIVAQWKINHISKFVYKPRITLFLISLQYKIET